MYTQHHARLAREAGDEAGAKKIEEQLKQQLPPREEKSPKQSDHVSG